MAGRGRPRARSRAHRAEGAARPSRWRQAARHRDMTIVGFDTALPVTSACVLLPDGRSFATPPPAPERLLGRPDHSAELLPVLAGLLEEAGVDWPDVRVIAVGVGPGTFTGLRIGVATARALATALRIG